jgi:hypothetical protein
MISESAVCNAIKYARIYQKENFLRKSITIKIDNECNRSIGVQTVISFNIKTSNVVISTCIKFCHCNIYPTVVGKQNCHDDKTKLRYDVFWKRSNKKAGPKYKKTNKGIETNKRYREKNKEKIKEFKKNYREKQKLITEPGMGNNETI